MARWPKRNPRPGVDEYGRTELWEHCRNAGDFEAVKQLLAAGADPNHQDDAGCSPLQIATLNGHIRVVTILLDAGANPNITDKYGNNPLWTAILSAPDETKVELISLLLNSGSDPHNKNKIGKTPYDMAMTIAHGLEVPFQKY